ncbi:MAG: pilin [Patescibacteria group bacterium]
MKILKISKIILALLFTLQLGSVIFFSAAGRPAAAQDNPTPLNFTPQIPINGLILNNGSAQVGTYKEATGKMSSDLLSRYIKAIYNYGLGIAGILAAIVLMGGGILWLTSGGESSRITQAKDLIIGSITGLIILFCSWIILNTVNPNLLSFKLLETTVIKKMSYCCDPEKGNVVMSDRDGKCSSGTVCQGSLECVNDGNNKFSCIDKSKFICCEYKKTTNYGVVVKCLSVKTGCPATPSGYDYSTYYKTYCGNKEIIAKNCLAGSCSEKDDGDKCEGINTNVSSCYCYNEIAWLGKGKEGQPCGNEKGSSCLKNGSKCDNHDYNGGRDCGDDLFCCQKINE